MALHEKKTSSGIEIDVASVASTEPEDKYPSSSSTTTEGLVEQQQDERNFINVPIPIADLEGANESEPVIHESRKKSFIDKLRGSNKGEEFKMVRMTRDEYFKYWAKDTKGNYIGTEPKGLGAERLKKGADGKSSMTLTKNPKEPVKQDWKDYLGPQNIITALGNAGSGGVGI